MHHHYLEIILFLVVVIAVAKAAGWASTKLGQPAVLGEILAGLLLGPTLIGVATLPLFPESREQKLTYAKQQSVIEEVGIVHQDRGDFGEDLAEEEIRHEIIGRISDEVHEAVVGTEELSLAAGDSRAYIADAASGAVDEIVHERKSFLEDVIKMLAELGVLFLMFMAGLETDLAMMKRVGKAALSAAIGGVIAPFILGFGVTILMIPHFGIYTAIFTGTILCATSVSISAQTLKELGALRSKEGTCILGAAVIDDILGIILLSLVIAFNPVKAAGASSHSKMYEVLANWITAGMGLEGSIASAVSIGILIISMLLFFFLFYMFGTVFFEKILRWAGNLPVSEPKLAFAIALGLFFAWAAEYIGAVAAITGTYLAGVLIGQTTHQHEIEDKLGVLTYSFFVPIFFINIGLEANARELGGGMLAFTIVICLTAILAKILGSFIGAKMGGFSFIESLRVGTGMVSRGEVGLIIASVGLSAGIIGRTEFSVMVIMVIVTTVVTPIMLRFLFPRNDNRDGQGANPDDDPNGDMSMEIPHDQVKT